MEEKDFDRIYELIEDEQFETARVELDEFLLKNPTDLEAQKLIALCEVNMENYPAAKYILEEIIKFKQDDALCWYYLGCCYDAESDMIAAKHAYLKVLELRPEYIDAYASLAIAYIKLEDYENAIAIGKKALEYTDEEDGSIYYILGTACMAAKNFAESVYFIEKALQYDPNNFQLYNNLGTSYLTIGDLEKAYEAYQKALEIDNSDSVTYFNIASILQLQAKHTEACEYFAKAHELEPEEDSYIVAWALSEVKAKQFDEAINHYKYLAATYPQKTNYKFNLACCYNAIGNYEVAIALLKQLTLLNPKAVNILKKLASVYITTGQLANAKDIYEKIIKQGSVSHDIYYELAQLCVKTDDLDKAEQTLKKVCGLNPDFAPAHKDLGVIYLNKRLFDYAKDEFEKAYEIAPQDPSIIVEYANYLHSTSDFVKADEYYQKALEFDPENATALAFSALNKTHLKQLDIAKEQITKILERITESAFLYYIAGRIYHLDKDYETAKRYLIKAYELEQIPDVQNLLALCYYELGNYEQANTIFLNMLKEVPKNITVMLNVANCYEKMGNNDEALKYAEMIVEDFAECEDAQEMIRRLS